MIDVRKELQRAFLVFPDTQLAGKRSRLGFELFHSVSELQFPQDELLHFGGESLDFVAILAVVRLQAFDLLILRFN